MPLVTLTELVNARTRQVAINPDHVAAMRPWTSLVAVDAQQGDPRTQVTQVGTIITLSTGEVHQVTQLFDEVSELFAPAPPAPPAPTSSAPAPTPAKKAVPNKVKQTGVSVSDKKLAVNLAEEPPSPSPQAPDPTPPTVAPTPE